MALLRGRCGGGCPGAPVSSCPPWKMSGGAFPCRSSTDPLFSAIPASVSGLSFGSSRAGWVTGFLCEHVYQQSVVTRWCFYPSAGMRWRALINQMEPLTRRWWAFIIWFTLSWMGPVLSLTQLPMIPSLWYVFHPQFDWQWMRLKSTFLTRDLQKNVNKINSLKKNYLEKEESFIFSWTLPHPHTCWIKKKKISGQFAKYKTRF